MEDKRVDSEKIQPVGSQQKVRFFVSVKFFPFFLFEVTPYCSKHVSLAGDGLFFNSRVNFTLFQGVPFFFDLGVQSVPGPESLKPSREMNTR